MNGTYRISAVPVLHTEGEYHGKLKRVIFTASSETDTREWFANNCGQFESAFSRIMPAGMARIILSSLLEGDQVELPGLYREEQFARGFLYEWSPVYFVAPPQFDQEPVYS